MQKPRLYPEDQARVDEVTRRGVNSVERKPFRVWILLGVILGVLTLLSVVSFVIARIEGVV
ncbi:DUF3094 family protein [Marinimicrobium sp. ARAG 43.8]|uniref:DUF3094 family protein n=1 Tax=Marinimicrobium sp. ARAG 43.8 TaxID=3418719 RepID=UPI003CF891FD